VFNYKKFYKKTACGCFFIAVGIRQIMYNENKKPTLLRFYQEKRGRT